MIELSGLTMTEQFAEAIGHSAMPGDNLILTGDLGAGKTTLTKGIAQLLENIVKVGFRCIIWIFIG